MDTWRFYLVLDKAELTEAECDALYEAGCDDGTVVTRNGVTYIAFDREADSLEAAVGSAVGEVMNAGHIVARAEVNDAEGGEGSRRVVWTTEDLVQDVLGDYFCHFVALSGCYHRIESAGNPTDHAGAFHYSGFILDVEDQWYWVTAAHVFDRDDDKGKGIETARQEGMIQIDECVLNDSFTPSEEPWTPIPFNYWQYDHIGCYDQAQGLDICAIRLSNNHRQLLEANGVVPLSEGNWQHEDLSRLDWFFLIGLPEELENTKVTPEPGGYHVRTKPVPAAVYISRVEEVPTDCIKPTPRFAGRVEKQAGNIEGMSGGPIFGVCWCDREHHHLVAVQSSRSRTRPGLIFGCPIGVIIQHLLRSEASNK